jgi:hypothetical protein
VILGLAVIVVMFALVTYISAAQHGQAPLAEAENDGIPDDR